MYLKTHFLQLMILRQVKSYGRQTGMNTLDGVLPIYIQIMAKPYVALNGYKNRGGYDLETGKEVWTMAGGGDIQIPTPINGNNLIYFNSAHGRNSPIIAVKTSAAGDITLNDKETSNEYIQWSLPRGGSYMHTMLLYNNHLYNVNWNGTVCMSGSNYRKSDI